MWESRMSTCHDLKGTTVKYLSVWVLTQWLCGMRCFSCVSLFHIFSDLFTYELHLAQSLPSNPKTKKSLNATHWNDMKRPFNVKAGVIAEVMVEGGDWKQCGETAPALSKGNLARNRRNRHCWWTSSWDEVGWMLVFWRSLFCRNCSIIVCGLNSNIRCFLPMFSFEPCFVVNLRPLRLGRPTALLAPGLDQRFVSEEVARLAENTKHVFLFCFYVFDCFFGVARDSKLSEKLDSKSMFDVIILPLHSPKSHQPTIAPPQSGCKIGLRELKIFSVATWKKNIPNLWRFAGLRVTRSNACGEPATCVDPHFLGQSSRLRLDSSSWQKVKMHHACRLLGFAWSLSFNETSMS